MFKAEYILYRKKFSPLIQSTTCFGVHLVTGSIALKPQSNRLELFSKEIKNKVRIQYVKHHVIGTVKQYNSFSLSFRNPEIIGSRDISIYSRFSHMDWAIRINSRGEEFISRHMYQISACDPPLRPTRRSNEEFCCCRAAYCYYLCLQSLRL